MGRYTVDLKNFKILVVTLVGLASNISTAAVSFGESVSLLNQPGFQRVSALKRQVGPVDTVCAPIVEVKSTFLCITYETLQMNETFTRMGFFWGSAKGVSAGTLISHESSILKTYNQSISGHNLPGNVILNFIKKAQSSKDANIRLSDVEQNFAQSFVSNAEVQKMGDQFYVIGVSVERSQSFKETVRHEIQHARYYLQPKVRNVINQFWKDSVTPEDKVNILSILGEAYNASNEFLMIDEFQAYLLSGSSHEVFAPYILRYRDLLIKALKEKADYLEIN